MEFHSTFFRPVSQSKIDYMPISKDFRQTLLLISISTTVDESIKQGMIIYIDISFLFG
jgi:hypothetical protein